MNRTDDIQGAAPEYRATRFTNKSSFYDPSDIKGAHSNILHKNSNSMDYTMKVDDIEGAQPKPYTFVTNRRVDPLVPKYALPTAPPAENVVPKFLRDSYDVSDITGTKPKPLFRFSQRHATTADIEGTQVGWRPRHQRVRQEGAPISHQFNVRDITDTGFKSMRVTDPLRPEYTVNGMKVADDYVKTMPRKLPDAAQHDYYNLQTSDIEGAQSGWKPPHEMYPPIDKRRHFRNTNFIGDIAGAQPDTVVHAIRTDRVTNPLQPVYQSLDGDRLGPPVDALELSGPEESSAPATSGPATDIYPTDTGDDKDALIAHLEGELKSLRGDSRGMDLAPSNPGPRAMNTNPAPATAMKSSSTSGMRPPAMNSARPSPRVPSTPAQRREAATLQADIDAVRGL